MAPFHMAPLRVTLKGQSRSHRFSMAYTGSKSIQDKHRVVIADG